MSDNLYLVGFMGSGKSTVGKHLADVLKRRFVDMDSRLEKEFGTSIAVVFEQEGEGAFRKKETRLLKRLAAKDRLVIATGGGVPQSSENRSAMEASGTIVHLDADLETCRKRLGGTDIASRPLWQDEESLTALYERRREVYALSHVSVTNHDRGPDAIAHAILERLVGETWISARLGLVDCPIVVTSRGPDELAEHLGDRRAAVLTDRTVERLHLNRFREVLPGAVEIVVRPGERSKTINGAKAIYERLLENHFNRDDVLVAVGGGVVTDLGAFVASTFKRGMGLILVSTTLVGCVDAAVGGKAAVNLGPAKNMVGSFSIPDAVILDVSTLRSLNRTHRSEGLVEAYKTGLVADPDLADLVQRHAKPLMAGDLLLMAEVTRLSAQAKADIVSADFRESGIRRILNFGHTFGHAVEGFHSFKVAHGTAVALGMRVSAEISRLRGLIPDDTVRIVNETISAISPYSVDVPPVGKAWEIMQHDKKIRSGRMVFVLLEGIGKPVCVDDVTRAELADALERMEDNRHE